MIDEFKAAAVRKAGEVITSPVALKVLSAPALQRAVLAAVNAQADLKDGVGKRVKDLAHRFDLATNEDLMKLRRQVRQLEADLDALKREMAELRKSPKSKKNV